VGVVHDPGAGAIANKCQVRHERRYLSIRGRLPWTSAQLAEKVRGVKGEGRKSNRQPIRIRTKETVFKTNLERESGHKCVLTFELRVPGC